VQVMCFLHHEHRKKPSTLTSDPAVRNSWMRVLLPTRLALPKYNCRWIC
jgi:hypothetical protein